MRRPNEFRKKEGKNAFILYLINVFHIVSQSKTRKMRRIEGTGGKWDAPGMGQFLRAGRQMLLAGLFQTPSREGDSEAELELNSRGVSHSVLHKGLSHLGNWKMFCITK